MKAADGFALGFWGGLQTKGRTKAETLAKELKETHAMVLVSLQDLRKQELVQQDSGIWSAIEIEEPF
jgi:hypothetical protein